VFFLKIKARKIFKFQYNRAKLFWLPCGFMLLMVLSGQLPGMNPYGLQLVNLAWVCAAILFAYRRELSFFIGQFRGDSKRSGPA
jgi:hypothetical protein